MTITNAQTAAAWIRTFGPRGPGPGYLGAAIDGQHLAASVEQARGNTDAAANHLEAVGALRAAYFARTGRAYLGA